MKLLKEVLSSKETEIPFRDKTGLRISGIFFFSIAVSFKREKRKR